MKNIKLILFLFLSFHLLSAQERVVYGTVADSTGEIPGANVVIKGTSKSTQTNFEGTYSIKAMPNDTLIFSFTGYKDIKVKADKTNINPILQEGIRLKEVAGPAYYPKRKMSAALKTTTVSSTTIATGQPKIQFETLSYDLGEIEQYTSLNKEIKFTNIGDKPLFIEQVQTTDDSGVASRSNEPVRPGKRGSIYYKRETSRLGRFIKTITVKTNDPIQPLIMIQLKGTIVAPQ